MIYDGLVVVVFADDDALCCRCCVFFDYFDYITALTLIGRNSTASSKSKIASDHGVSNMRNIRSLIGDSSYYCTYFLQLIYFFITALVERRKKRKEETPHY
jgi:hypothetical protein